MTHGGKRTGSGRPRGSNIWGESTKSIRLPISKIPAVQAFLENGGSASVDRGVKAQIYGAGL